MAKKLISISLSPNVFPQDITAARAALADPFHWIKGSESEMFQKELARFFSLRDKENVFLFNSGRSALLAILQSFGIGKGDEVLLQAFTCNAVPNPILWVGAKPVYVDANEATFNISLLGLEKKITPKAKAIIIQHTFGLPGPLEEVLQLAKVHNLFVIEDCAHALGASYKGKKVGLFGDAAFFSFGRDKVISSVYGGAAIVSEKRKKKSEKLKKIYQTLPYPDVQWTKQQLRHPIAMERLLDWYNFPVANHGVGKLLLQLSQSTKYLSKAVHWKEKQGLKPDYFPAKLPDALAGLALLQFQRLDEFNAHRLELAEFYFQKLQATSYKLQAIKEGHSYLRYPVRHPHAHQLIAKARKEGMLLGDWYTSPVAPDDTNLEKVLYKKGSCPSAEKLSRETFNLPTNPNLSLQEAGRVIQFLKTVDMQ